MKDFAAEQGIVVDEGGQDNVAGAAVEAHTGAAAAVEPRTAADD